MASQIKVPASIANASREELERLLISSLQKLKSRDKRIDELSKAANAVSVSEASADAGAEELQTAIKERDQAAKQVGELEATVSALQAKLISSEQAFNERLTAEQELLADQITQLRKEVEIATTALTNEREGTQALQESLGAREALITQLQEASTQSEEAKTALNEQIQQLQSQLEEALAASAASGAGAASAEKAWTEERAALEARAESAQQQIQEAKEAVKVESEAVKARLEEEITRLQGEVAAKAEEARSLEKIKKENEQQREQAAVKDDDAVVAIVTQQVEELQNKLKAAQEDAKKLNSDLQDREQQLDEAHAQIQKHSEQLNSLQKKLAAAEESSVSLASTSQAEVDTLKTQISELIKGKKALEAEIERLNGALTSTAAELEEQMKLNASLQQQPVTPVPSPIKAIPSEASIDMDSIATPPPSSSSSAAASAAVVLAPDADAATLRAECERLAKELLDTKRKFLIAAKRKKEEMAAKVAEMEEKIKQAETAAAATAGADTAAASTSSAPAASTPADAGKPKEEDLVLAAEAARAEVTQIKKEVETERGRFKRAIAESKRRTDAVQREKEAAEASAAQSNALAESLRAELAAAEQKASAAVKNAEAALEELKEYKNRAHALLKTKEVEIRESKSIALQEQSAALEAAESAAISAEAAAARAQQELESVKRRAVEDLAAARSERDTAVAELQREARSANDSAAAANRQYEQVKLRYESLETRTQLLQEQLATATAAVAEADLLKIEMEELKKEHACMRETALTAAHAKDTELAASREACVALKEEISSLQSVLDGLKAAAAARAASAGMTTDGTTTTNGGVHSRSASLTLERSLSLSGRKEEHDDQDDNSMATASIAELAKRERELATVQRRMLDLQREVADLEREVDLRDVQETALKEAVRELEREIERMKLAGKTVDMEYFKNVMLKLFETGAEESLLPVVSTMLQFSPAEMARCRKALEERATSQNVPRGARGEAVHVTSYLSSWLGIGGAADEGTEEEERT